MHHYSLYGAFERGPCITVVVATTSRRDGSSPPCHDARVEFRKLMCDNLVKKKDYELGQSPIQPGTTRLESAAIPGLGPANPRGENFVPRDNEVVSSQ